MNRGILSTAYCRLRTPLPVADLRALYQTFYKNDRFVRLSHDVVPNPRYIKGSNYCDIGVYADARAGWIVTVAALDNLVKGAAGQAIQAMNLMLGLPEDTGLSAAAAYP
jgi:N-acetyl-gamma-glutamyl-phosphate reductase